MSFRELELRVPADVRYLSLIRKGIRSLTDSMGFCRPDVADVEIAVSEAVTNSVEHGCGANTATIAVRCTVFDDYITVEVEDESGAAALPADIHVDCTSERGRGILMMQALMDSFEGELTPHGVRVKMGKHLAQQNQA